MAILEDLLGFTLLKAVNLSGNHKQLVKTISTHIDHYETIKAKTKFVFLNKVQATAVFDHAVNIKAEPKPCKKTQLLKKKAIMTIIIPKV